MLAIRDLTHVLAVLNAATIVVLLVAYRRIRGDIVFGRLSPGQKLTLDRMKEAYGASVSTLREILNRLSSEGLIVAEGARGFEVMPVSPDDLRQIASMRELLEGHALISACGSRVLLDTHATIYDRYLRYQMIAAVYRGEAASGEHRRLLDSALARDWRAAQKTLGTHIQDCVTQMLRGGLIAKAARVAVR